MLGAPANDFHALPSALVADVVRGRGLAVVDLGANTPDESFVETVASVSRLVATGIVMSTKLDNALVAATIAAIKTATDAPIVLGGVAVRNASHARRLGADASTSSARAAVEWFDATVGQLPKSE